VKVHLDDVEPYYTIWLKDDGREKQTNDSRLLRTTMMSDSNDAEIITAEGPTHTPLSTIDPGIEIMICINNAENSSGTAATTTEFIPLYKAGTDILYKNAIEGVLQPPRIAKVHLDNIKPYYTIKMAGDNGGREKQTDNTRLWLAATTLLEEDDEREQQRQCSNDDEEEEELSVVTEKGANDEDRLLLAGEKKVEEELEEGGGVIVIVVTLLYRLLWLTCH